MDDEGDQTFLFLGYSEGNCCSKLAFLYKLILIDQDSVRKFRLITRFLTTFPYKKKPITSSTAYSFLIPTKSISLTTLLLNYLEEIYGKTFTL
jgi:hypothetical protein